MQWRISQAIESDIPPHSQVRESGWWNQPNNKQLYSDLEWLQLHAKQVAIPPGAGCSMQGYRANRWLRRIETFTFL